MDSRRNGAVGLGLAALLVASPAPAQLVSSEEAQARRQCIGEAGRRGWQVEEVVGFRAAGGGRYDVSLRASQRGTFEYREQGRDQ